MSRLKELRKSILFGVYLSLSLIFILPIWITEYFITLEGPLVNYFGIFVRDVVFNGQSWYSTYYKILDLNYTGSLSLLLQLLKGTLISASYFDKIIASSWIIIFLWLSRSIILGINAKADYRPFLIFPFIFCLPFFQGDWNFLSGIVALLGLIKLLNLAQQETISTLKLSLGISFCLFLAGISSLSIYLLILILGFSFFYLNPNKNLKKRIHWVFLIPAIIFSLPIIILNKGIIKHLEFNELSLITKSKDLIYFETLVSFQGDTSYALILLSVVFLILFIFSLISIFYRLKPDKNQRFWHQMLFAASFISLLLFFLLPNSNYSMVTNHLHWMFLSSTFLILSLACLRLKKSWMITLALFSVIISVAHLRPQFLNWSQFSQNKKLINRFSAFIPTNSKVSVYFEELPYYKNFVFDLVEKQRLIIDIDNHQAIKEFQYYSGISLSKYSELIKTDSEYALCFGNTENKLGNEENLQAIFVDKNLSVKLYKIMKPAN